MQIQQFEDKSLSHFSYAILDKSERKIILIDPSRDAQPYLDFATANNASIIGVIETHLHADFVSSHLELYEKQGATIYVSKLANATYPHQPFDEGQSINIGSLVLTAINTAGHSPDSICILLEEEGRQKAIFTGDTLFIGDCGRPDLRPGVSDAEDAATKLASQMYHSLTRKIMPLDDSIIIYPAHGAGTLCGKSLSDKSSSTLAEEKKSNWCLQQQTEEEFIKELLSDQPFVPAYFPFNVTLNKKGARPLQESIDAVKIWKPITNNGAAAELNPNIWIIDSRKEREFKNGHLPYSINLMNETKFETWLGSIIKPGEPFYITAATEKDLNGIIKRTASIGYETQVSARFVLEHAILKEQLINLSDFEKHPNKYSIIDVRNESEAKEKTIFPGSINIPLADLRERVTEIPTDKPIVVHCAGGFRSAAGSSLLKSVYNKAEVFDLGEHVKKFL